MHDHEALTIRSFRDLVQHEREILRRIESTPNGGILFVAHPLRLLADVGVALTPAARDELLEREPMLAVVPNEPYEALKRTRARQRVRFHLKHLFRREVRS